MTITGFDLLAPFYDNLTQCVYGKSIKKSQLSTLHFISKQATVLIIGGGTGWFLHELLTKRQVEKVVYIESSQKMLALSRKKVSVLPEQIKKVDFRLGTEECIGPNEQFDVVITHFFLDLFTSHRLEKIMIILSKALNKNGIWLCTDFQLSEHRSSLWWKNILLGAMYLFFRVCCKVEANRLPDINQIFTLHHMCRIYESHFFGGFIAGQVYKHKAYY